MARRIRARRKDQLQSPLLSLPAELRYKIYGLALVRDQPIDLWPHKWTEPGNEAPSSSRSILTDYDRPHNLKVRHQEDLAFVRKELSVGLLGTCTQVYREAAKMFWGENCWKFSGRSGWQGLLRFLLTIGPEARMRIRRLDVHAPVYMRWPVKDVDNKDMNGRSKNYPKMHMAKIPSEGHLDRTAIQRVCAILSQERCVEEINFVIPAGFRNGDEDEFGGYEEDHDMEPDSKTRIARIQEDLGFSKKTVVIEAGGYLATDHGPAQIMEKGWDVVCLPGSFIWEKGEEDKGGNTDYQKREVTETRKWASPAREWDYLEGVRDLLETSDVSVHADAGKRKVTKLLRPRRLTAFGGCKFIEDDGIIMPLQQPSGLET